jgi:hypothetical protein
VQPTDLGPPLHSYRLGPPELAPRRRAMLRKPSDDAVTWPDYNRGRWPSFHPAPTERAVLASAGERTRDGSRRGLADLRASATIVRDRATPAPSSPSSRQLLRSAVPHRNDNGTTASHSVSANASRASSARRGPARLHTRVYALHGLRACIVTRPRARRTFADLTAEPCINLLAVSPAARLGVCRHSSSLVARARVFVP